MTAIRGWTAFAFVGWSLTVAGAVAGLLLRIAWPAPMLATTFGIGPTSLVPIAALGVTWSTVGAILVVRRPDNPVGRIMVVVGAVHAISVLTVAIAFFALAEGTAAGRDVASVAGALTALLTPILVLEFYLAFIFPTGRGHTPRWDKIGRLYLWAMMTFAALLVLQPGDNHLLPGIHNPIGFGPDLRPVFGERVAAGVSAVAAAPVAPIAILSLLSRYRLAGPIERQQLKWFILAVAVTISALLVMATGAAVIQSPAGESPMIVFAVASTTVPVAIGIAILRYRLFEIDRIISRTIAYAVISGILAVVFAGLVLALQAVLAPVTQGDSVAVAASTLIVLTLFEPVRTRVKAVVDRRFHRTKVGGERTIVAFADRLRNELDLSSVGRDLVATADAMVEPREIAVWLRGSVTIRGRDIRSVRTT